MSETVEIQTASVADSTPMPPPDTDTPEGAAATPRKKRELPFRPTEIALLLVGLFLLLGSSALYVSGVSLRKLFLGWEDEQGRLKVGLLDRTQGSTLRLLHNSSEFKILPQADTLYNYDSVMTSEAGSATLKLDDGSVIELEANTLVKLMFDPAKLAATKIEVVQGNVNATGGSAGLVLRNAGQEILISPQGRGKLGRVTEAPKPVEVVKQPESVQTPQPTLPIVKADQVEFVFPRQQDVVAIDDLKPPLKKNLTMEWKVKGGDASSTMALYRYPSGYARGRPEFISKQTVQSQAGRAKIQTSLTEPGDYEWVMVTPDGKPMLGKNRKPLKSRFTLAREVLLIDSLPTLYGGQEGQQDNLLRGKRLKNFDITLRWSPKIPLSKYQIQISNKPDVSRVLLQRPVQSTSYSFNKDKMLTGKLYFKITSPLPKGFVAVSKIGTFGFAFLPPVLVSPRPNQTLTLTALQSNDNSLLMTWQKTNFTLAYEVQVSSDPQFTKPLIMRRTPENFFLLKSLRTGRFYWRTRSISTGNSSEWSDAWMFQIVP